MIRFQLTGVAIVIVSFGLVVAGCQDSLVNPSPESSPSPEQTDEDASSSVPVTPQIPNSKLGFGRCDATVSETQTIQGAVDAAGSGDVLCVSPGTYEEQVTVDRAVTVRGKTPAFSGNPAVVEGWISLEADGAALRSLVVTRDAPFSTPGNVTPDPFGIRVTASNAEVVGTVVHSIGEAVPSGSINGIQVFGASAVSDVEISYNLVRDVENVKDDGSPAFGVAGIKVQADASDVTVRGNVVRELHGLFGYGVALTSSASAEGVPSEVRVTYNTLTRINDGSVFDVFSAGGNEGRDAPGPYPGSAVAIDGAASAGEATVQYNNLLAPNGIESKDEENSLQATCNWWDDPTGPTHSDNSGGKGTWVLERGPAEVEYTTWLVAPSPSQACIGGRTPGWGGGPLFGGSSGR